MLHVRMHVYVCTLVYTHHERMHAALSSDRAAEPDVQLMKLLLGLLLLLIMMGMKQYVRT